MLLQHSMLLAAAEDSGVLTDLHCQLARLQQALRPPPATGKLAQLPPLLLWLQVAGPSLIAQTGPSLQPELRQSSSHDRDQPGISMRLRLSSHEMLKGQHLLDHSLVMARTMPEM